MADNTLNPIYVRLTDRAWHHLKLLERQSGLSRKAVIEQMILNTRLTPPTITTTVQPERKETHEPQTN